MTYATYGYDRSGEPMTYADSVRDLGYLSERQLDRILADHGLNLDDTYRYDYDAPKADGLGRYNAAEILAYLGY